jgi:antitoxin component of MazEF toxin-antitoxin module
MEVIRKPIQIGNSKGVRIPATLIRSYRLDRGFVMKATHDGILISPVSGLKLSMEESFAAMVKDDSDLSTALEWVESGLSDGLED